MLNIAVLVSGGGTNLQALLDSEARGENPSGKIRLVVASKPGVYALERAANAGVEGVVVRRKDYASSEDFDAALLKTLKEHNIDLVVLAGFLSVLGPSVIEAYPRRILNIHPALIPSFCGPGMYGLRPHEAALARGELPEFLRDRAVFIDEFDTFNAPKKRLMGALLASLPTVTVALCDDGTPLVPGDMSLFSGAKQVAACC